MMSDRRSHPRREANVTDAFAVCPWTASTRIVLRGACMVEQHVIEPVWGNIVLQMC